jgi:hypothetical protein
LKKKKISSNFDNILDRFNVNDDYNNITKEQLEEILTYACNSKYVSKANYNNKVSYRVNVNDKEIEGSCKLCNENLIPYKSEDFIANKLVEYITRETFESLAHEIYDLKSKLHGLTLNIHEIKSQEDDTQSNLIFKLKEQNSILLERIKFKDEQIVFLMSEISKKTNIHSNINSSRFNKSDHVTMETDNNKRRTNDYLGWKTAKSNSYLNTHSILSLKNHSKSNEVPLYNRYNGLINEEFSMPDDDERVNDSCFNGSCFNGVTLNRDSNYINRTRPEIVVNEHCDNDILLRHDAVKKMYPGNSTYADITNRGKKICLLGDSIIRRIDISEFAKCMNDGNAIKRCFPGCSSKQMQYYVKEVLEEAHPDTMIIHVGTNDITKSQSSEKEIAHNVIKIVNTCRNEGVNKIIVSALTLRPKFSAKIEAFNKLLGEYANSHNYIFLDNSQIRREHLWKDKLHLNDDGIVLLANNFLNSLYERTVFDNWY